MIVYNERYHSPYFPTFTGIPFHGICFCLETARKILLIRNDEEDDE